MSTDLPMACSLSDNDLTERLAEIAQLGRAALLEAHHDGTHAELRFAVGAGVRQRIDAIVAAESRCCAFLAMHVSDAPTSVVLTIDAPAGADEAVAEIVDAFRGQPPAA
jgi:hypothetical protein